MSSALDQSRPVRSGEELDVARLEPYLLEHLPGSNAPLTIEQFPSGYSNLTYLLRLGDQELVLRRPPFGNQVKSAHDMGREYRVLSRLCKVYAPAPRPLLHCDDPTIIGDAFYVMERRRGVILRKPTPPPELADHPDLVRRLCESFIDNLAALHTLDYAAAGLGDLGRPDGYVERQVTGWSKRYADAKTDDYPEVEQLSEWVQANRPDDSGAALVHNDYKYDNIVLDAHDLTQIVAVLDWEMATIGDPLMDLGSSLAYWVEPGDAPTEHARAFGPTMARGSLTRRELLEAYAARTGADVSNMMFYYCFGLFKLAAIIQQIYARYRRGVTQDPRFASLNMMVQSLGRRGIDAIAKDSI
ncbi:MAG: phosphotransferase family protein [Planctomycetaceae bacterium]|nr:phosphotransferase family protein [Planctomycetaceae bacterium]